MTNVQTQTAMAQTEKPGPIVADDYGYRCCAFPHGDSFFLPFLFTTIAWTLSIVAQSVCTFADREIIFPEGASMENIFLPYNTTVGIWNFQGHEIYSGICFIYPTFMDTDSAFRSAQAFSVLSGIFGFLAMIRIWFAACIPMMEATWKCTGFYLILTCMFEGLTFLLYNSFLCKDGVTPDGIIYQSNCKLASGGNYAIAATVFWFFAGVSVCNVTPPEYDVYGPVVLQKKIITTTKENIDGTKTTTTETKMEYV